MYKRQEVGRVHEGMPVKLTIGALQNLSFDATLEYISPKGVEENGCLLYTSVCHHLFRHPLRVLAKGAYVYHRVQRIRIDKIGRAHV